MTPLREYIHLDYRLMRLSQQQGRYTDAENRALRRQAQLWDALGPDGEEAYLRWVDWVEPLEGDTTAEGMAHLPEDLWERAAQSGWTP